MYCRSRPQYPSGLGWTLGVAFLGTLTRPEQPAQGFTCVRCCSAPPASFPHRPRGRAVAFRSWLLPTRATEDFHLQSRVHAWHTKGSGQRLEAPPTAAQAVETLDRPLPPAKDASKRSRPRVIAARAPPVTGRHRSSTMMAGIIRRRHHRSSGCLERALSSTSQPEISGNRTAIRRTCR